MSAHSNVDAVAAQLAKLADCLDMTRGFGRDALAHIAVKISDRAQAEQGPSGEWAPNKGKYGDKKRSQGLPVGVGLKAPTGPRMLSLLEIQGTTTIAPTEASMEFGVDKRAKELGGYFTEGRGGVQAPRPFYQMTSEDTAELLEMAEKEVSEFVREL